MSTRGKYTQRRVAKKKKQNVEYNNQQIGAIDLDEGEGEST